MKTEITVLTKLTTAEVIEKLKECNFEYDSYYVMEDVYYSSKGESVHSLSYPELIASSFLTRRVSGENEVSEQIIYKNKNYADGVVLGETKVRVNVENVENLNKVLTLSGFTPWCRMVTNMTYLKRGNVTIIVQEVEGLGTYLELEEYEDIKLLTSEEKFNHLVELVKSFNIDTYDNYSEKKVYSLFKGETNGRI